MASSERAATEPGAADGRERRRAWVIDTATMAMREVEAFSCAPSVPDYWWVPSMGYSLPAAHLYDAEIAAIEEALRQCRERIIWHQQREEKLLVRWEQERRAGAEGGDDGKG